MGGWQVALQPFLDVNYASFGPGSQYGSIFRAALQAWSMRLHPNIATCVDQRLLCPLLRSTGRKPPIEVPYRARSAMTRASGSASAATQQQVSALLSNLPVLPRIIVFDLDYCLWPFWCEMYTVHDQPKLYPDTKAILDGLREHGVPMALASRTPTPNVARAFLQKLGLTHYFANVQLIPAADGYDQHSAQKDTAHFPNLRRETGIEYPEMLFYDDEHKNVAKVARLGVCSVHVSSSTGVNLRELERGLREYAAARGQRQGQDGAGS